MDIIEQVALYINNIPDDHLINRTFGAKLFYHRQDVQKSTLRPYGSPIDDISSPLGVQNPPVVIVQPSSAGYVDQNRQINWYYFKLLCRHTNNGAAFRVLNLLATELDNNSRVLSAVTDPCKKRISCGTIFKLSPMPAQEWQDKTSIVVYSTTMRATTHTPL